MLRVNTGKISAAETLFEVSKSLVLVEREAIIRRAEYMAVKSVIVG